MGRTRTKKSTEKKRRKKQTIRIEKHSENDPVILKLEQAFALDASIEEACLFAGIVRKTYYNIIAKHPELAERFAILRNTPVLKARKAVIDSFEKDPFIALKYLEKKRRIEFGSQEINIGGYTINLAVYDKDAAPKIIQAIQEKDEQMKKISQDTEEIETIETEEKQNDQDN